jgi:hypothetical protein
MAPLTVSQSTFVSRLAADTGLDPGVVTAWALSEESGTAAAAREHAGNNDWLNIGYTGSATFGASDSIWSSPATAADATAQWLKGAQSVPGYGTASKGIQSILGSSGQSPSAQIAAIQNSGWASSGYPLLASVYNSIKGSVTTIAAAATGGAGAGSSSSTSSSTSSSSGAYGGLGGFLLKLALTLGLLIGGLVLAGVGLRGTLEGAR